jgi:hypothetical protein
MAIRRFATSATAAMLACWAPAASVGAVELLTGDGYLYALTQDGQARAEALSYLSGTFDNLLVLNEVLSSEDTPLFCMSEQQAVNLDSERLKADFGEWLKQPVETSSGERTAGTLPVALLGWGFLSDRFACATAEAAASNAEVRALLLDSVRK